MCKSQNSAHNDYGIGGLHLLNLANESISITILLIGGVKPLPKIIAQAISILNLGYAILSVFAMPLLIRASDRIFLTSHLIFREVDTACRFLGGPLLMMFSALSYQYVLSFLMGLSYTILPHHD